MLLCLAAVIRWVDRCHGAWVLLGFFCLLCVPQAPTQQRTRRSSRCRSIQNAAVNDQIYAITVNPLTPRRIVSAPWQAFVLNQLQVREGKGKVLARRMRDMITRDLGLRAPFIDVVAPGCGSVLMCVRSCSSHVLAVSSSFKLIRYSSPAGAFKDYVMHAPIRSVLQH